MMAKQFRTPPGWPAPPTGWTPPPGWQPDPAWPPAPPGWVFWTDVAAAPPPPPSTSGVYIPPPPSPPAPTAPAADDVAPLSADVEAAIDRMGRTLGIRRELGRLAGKLDPGERVIELARIKRQDHGCLLVVTDRRLLFLREGMIRSRIEELPLRAITSVGSRRRLVNGYLEVTVAGDKEVWHMTSASHSERVSASIRAQVRAVGAG